MIKRYIVLVNLIIFSVVGGYFVLNTQKAGIWKYKIEEWRDGVRYNLGKDKNVDVEAVLKIPEKQVIEKEKVDDGVKSEKEADKDAEVITSVEPVVQKVKKDEEVINNELPSEFQLDMTFVLQAPNGNWDAPYQEACEEASMIMTEKYIKKKLLGPDIMDEEIKALVEWEMENFGYYEHTDVEDVVVIMEDYFGLDTSVIDNPEIEELKKILYSGNPILVPVAGRELGNPYFSGKGPIYHMLVLIGWKGSRWVTNDPGTRQGRSFTYSFDRFMPAIHDSPVAGDEIITQELIMTGARRVIEVDNK